MNTELKQSKRIELIKKEISECEEIIESSNLERDISLLTNDSTVLEIIGEQLSAMYKRLNALHTLLEKELNPESKIPFEDFVLSIQII